MTDPHALSQIEEIVRERAPGWEVTVNKDGERVRVELSHPLSDGQIGDFEVPAYKQLMRWLGYDSRCGWEIDLLRTAPGHTPHAETIRFLARDAELFAWSNAEVKAVVSLLPPGELTVEEHEWVCAMIGEDAPGRPKPNPQPMRARGFEPRAGAG